MPQPHPRLRPTEAEGTCLLCGWTTRSKASTAILASLAASQAIIRHRQSRHPWRKRIAKAP